MDYGPVVDRLRAQCPGYSLVDFAATYEALKARLKPDLPAALVLPAPESGARNKLGSGGVHNQVRFRFRTYTLVRYAGDAFGLDSADLLEPLRAQLRNALMGWRLPDPAPGNPGDAIAKPDGPVEFGSADFVQFMDGILVFFDQFEFDGYYRRVS